jgi:predicted amidohydrolase
MIRPFIGVAIQANVYMPNVSDNELEVRKTINKNLHRTCELIDWSAREVQRTKKASMVAGVGESFLHSFPRAKGGAVHDLLKACIHIPGEEIQQLAKKARENGIYIFGAAFEIDDEWGDQLFFNTGFLISPEGKVILKYRKNHGGPIDSYTTPHDVLEEYTRKYGPDSLFPVVDTPIGKMGCMICSDGFLPETARGLALNGAEVILFPISTFEPIHQQYHLGCCARAFENNVYIISPNIGHTYSNERPEAVAGNSIIVDYLGRPLIATKSTGETTISALIDIESLRCYRETNTFAFLPWMRNEAYLSIYQKTMRPANQFLKAPKSTIDEEVKIHQKTVASLFKGKIFSFPSE